MAWYDDAWSATKRGGLAVATGGLSEGMGARPVLDLASGNSDYTKNLLFGGDATKGIDGKPLQYDQVTNQLGQIAASAQSRAAPTMQGTYRVDPSQLATGQMNQSRGGLMGVAGNLGSIASGQQMGAGEMAVNRQVGQANAAQHSAAMAARGANAALAYRNSARNMADIGLGGAAAAGQAQLQDQQAANAQLAGIYGGMYGQDANVAAQNAQLSQQAGTTNAQLGQQAALANQQAQLTQTQMNDARQIQALGQQLGWDQARINAELQKAGIAATDKGILPGLLQMGGQIGAAYATGGLSSAAGAGAARGGGGGAGPGIDPIMANL